MMKTAFLEILTAAFNAGETKVYAMAGEYFELIDSAYPVDVRLVDKYGAQRGLMRGAETSFFIKAGDFDTIEITSALAQTIRFAFGTSEAGTRRTSGVVQVIDGEKARTLAGGMFAGSPTIAAVASNFANVQLWNPAGSGKNLIVSQLEVNPFSGQNVVVHMSATVLTDTYNFAAANKRSNGPAPVALLRRETKVAAESVYALGIMKNIEVPVNDTFTWRIAGAVVVQPGYGLNITSTVGGGGIRSAFEWFEETI